MLNLISDMVDVHNASEVAWTILGLVAGLKTQYGKGTLSKVLKGSKSKYVARAASEAKEVYGCLSVFSEEQVDGLVQQLIDAGYLEVLQVGTMFEVNVLGLTDKGRQTLDQHLLIDMTLPKVYSAEFTSGGDVPILDKEVLDEYYQVKVELSKLIKKEGELKEQIKKAMTDNQFSNIHTENMDLFCKKVERVLYPKDKVEALVPEELLEKIRVLKETVVLVAKLKVKEEVRSE